MPTRAQRRKTAFKIALTGTSVDQVDKAPAAPELNVNGKRDRQAGEQEEAEDANAAGPSQTASPLASDSLSPPLARGSNVLMLRLSFVTSVARRSAGRPGTPRRVDDERVGVGSSSRGLPRRGSGEGRYLESQNVEESGA